MSDKAPADWYTDPDDDSLYRYWDGSAWTEHRAPRHAEPADHPAPAPGGLRGPGQLIGDSFSLVVRRWRGCAAAAAVSIAGQLVMVLLAIFAANAILMGELGEIWGRINETGFDPEAPEHKSYFESLKLDLSFSNFALIAVGLIIVWVTSNLMKAVVLRLTLADMRDRTLSVSEAMSQAPGRVLRLMGLDIQVTVIVIVAVLVPVVAGAIEPLLLILLIPAAIGAVVMALAVFSLAYVVAAAGPSGSSLLYAARLVRGRLGASLGRVLLVILIVVAVSVAAGLVSGGVAGAVEQLFLPAQLIQAVVGAAATVLGLAATAILYRDLGGESD